MEVFLAVEFEWVSFLNAKISRCVKLKKKREWINNNTSEDLHEDEGPASHATHERGPVFNFF